MKVFILFCVFILSVFCGYSQILRTDSMTIQFISDALLEKIEARSVEAKGVLDKETKHFAFEINVSSFLGFNNDLQRIHFLENYMEINKYTKATFTGRLLDDLGSVSNSFIKVKSKGSMNIHGVNDERILNVEIKENDLGGYDFKCSFIVKLIDHNIAIPRIVHHKISEEIEVNVSGTLK